MQDILVAPGPMPDWASYSAFGTFRACPQRWKYAYLQRLSKPASADDAKVELNFGIWWHALRAAYSIETGWARGTLLFCPRTLGTPAGDLVVGNPTHVGGDPKEFSLPERVRRAAMLWFGQLPEEHKAQWTERLGDTTLGRLEELDKRWWLQHGKDDLTEDPIGVEVKWTRKLPSGLELLGYIDYIYRDLKRGIVAARDYKTQKQLDSQTAADDMMDSQLQLYAWGVTPLLKEKGLQVAALSYDRVRSVKATTPKLTQMGGLSKSVTMYDWVTYLEWCREGQDYPGRTKDGSQAGTYELDEDHLAFLKGPLWTSRWFQRTLVPLNRNLVISHLRAAQDTAAAMEALAPRLAETDEAPRNLSHDNCRYCDFSALCRAQMFGGPEGEYAPENFGLVARQ